MAAPARVANNSPKRQEPPAGPPAKQEEETPPSRLAWFLGWVGVPGLVFGGIFGAGVLVGAHYPDGWIAWAVGGIAGLFS